MSTSTIHRLAPKRPVSANGAQAIVDRIQAEARAVPGSRIRRDPPPKPAPLEPSDRVIDQRLAEEIDYARRLLKATGEAIAADSVCLQRHLALMQRFDLIEQTLGHLSTVAGAADPCEAIGRIGMQELRARLNRGALGGEAPCKAA